MLRRPTRPSPRPRRGARGLVAAGVTLAVAAAGAGTTGVVLTASSAPAVPTVFIAQVIPNTDPEYVGGTNSTLRHAVQSRLANSGNGGVEIHSIGAAASMAYNAVGYRVADNDLYGIASTTANLVQIRSTDGVATTLGAVTGLPAPSGGSYAAGAFGEGATADVLYVKTNVTTSDVYAVDVATRTVVATIDPSQDFNAIDLTWSDGYLWGVEISGSTKTLIRLDVTGGTVTRIPTGTVFPSADASGYGAAWTYGNGNLAFSNNGTGTITQVTVHDPAAAVPTITRVSTIAGPSTSSNDGATSPSAPADLQLTVTPPAPAAPSSPITWQVVVSNAGPGGSSGGVFQFDVPAGVTAVSVPTGCTLTGAHVQCVSGQLPDGTSDTYDFSGTSPAAATVGSSSVVTVIGNELDTAANTATLVVAPAARTLTSTGPGPVAQSVSSGVPAGGTATLLDGDGDPVTSLTVSGEGTYAVSGSSFTFTPVNGWTGTAPAVAFRLTAADGNTGTGTYTATVTAPAAPVAGDRSTTGVGTAPQSTTVTPAPSGGSLTLLDADGDPATTVTVTGGTYALDAATATVTFTPDLGYSGSPTPAAYRVTDAYGQADEGAHQPTVTTPAPPSASPFTSTGVGTAAQSPATAVTVPGGGSVTLLDGSTPVTTLTVPDEGTYALDAATGVLTFTPVLGFSGTATAADYRVTDAYGQTAASTYTAEVTPPTGPAAPARTSTGVGTAAQGQTLTVPTSGTVTLLDADGDPVTSLTVPGEGGYELDPATGAVTFTPVLGFSGAATPVDYRVVDAYGTSAQGIYTPAVTPPAAPVVPDRSTSGPAVTAQETTVTLPPGGTLVLLDGGTPRTTLTVAGQGTYAVVGGTVRFTPVAGFSGPAAPVTTRVTDAYGQAVTATWTATVVPPAAPSAPTVTSSGTGTQAHTVSLTVPPGGTVTLLDGSTPVTSLTVPGEGTYTLDPATGAVTFAPAAGFSGTAHGAAYRVTDAYGQTATGTAVPTVAKPSAPPASRLSTAGAAGVAQRATAIPVPAGGSVTLLDASGAAVDTVVVAGQGTYVLDRATGVVTFTPLPGFSGEATPVTYRVTDAYGQAVEGSYGASVEAAPAAPAPAAALASTGTDALPLLVLAGFLVVGGAVLVVVGRRRGRAEVPA